MTPGGSKEPVGEVAKKLTKNLETLKISKKNLTKRCWTISVQVGYGLFVIRRKY